MNEWEYEYIKLFDTPEQADQYPIDDNIPFITTAYTTKQNLRCDINDRKIKKLQNDILTIAYNIPNDEIWYTSVDGNIIQPNVDQSKISSNDYNDEKGIIKFKEDVDAVSSEMFRNNSNLKTITIPYSVEEIAYASFHYCTNLEKVNNVNENITYIGNNAFKGCNKLTTFDIPQNLTSVDEFAFDGTSLKSFVIPKTTTYIGQNVVVSKNMWTITVENGNPNYDSRNCCNAIIETATDTLILGCKTTKIPNDITYIGDHAFWFCTRLKTIKIPNNIVRIGSSAFSGCRNLININIGNGVTNISNNAFSGCISLKRITIPDNVTNIGYECFNGCNNLEFVTLSNNITIIESYLFYYCISLTSITIPNNVTNIKQYAFHHCINLSSVYIRNKVRLIGNCAFSDCSSLTTIYFGGTKSEWARISKGTYWHQGVPSTTKVYCSESDEYVDMDYTES